MFTVRRLILHNVRISDEWEEHTIKKSLAVFLLTDEEFMFLQGLPREYEYHEFDNEFYVDRHPSLLREGIDNEDFLQDYEQHLTDKFFVLYEYQMVEEDG